jgi:hypothetical protein
VSAREAAATSNFEKSLSGMKDSKQLVWTKRLHGETLQQTKKTAANDKQKRNEIAVFVHHI